MNFDSLQFEEFYNKRYNGRKLSWLHHLSNGKSFVLCYVSGMVSKYNAIRENMHEYVFERRSTLNKLSERRGNIICRDYFMFGECVRFFCA